MITFKIHKETELLENFMHRTTGIEFCFDKTGHINGIQCTDLKQYKLFIKVQKIVKDIYKLKRKLI